MKNAKLQAIAIDDEQHCLDTLVFELERFCPEVELVDQIVDARVALETLKSTDVDLVFLDIHLQSTSGITLLEQLLPVDFDVIFVTAYDEYAIKAFDLSAAHYLLKPVNGKKLKSAVDKVIEKRRKEEQAGGLEQFMQTLKSNLKSNKRLAFPVQDGLEFIDPNHIEYIEGDSNYSTLHMYNRRPILVSKTLKYLEENILSSDFIRIHKSFLINVTKLSKYIKRDGGYVVMESGKKLSVSRHRKQILNDMF